MPSPFESIVLPCTMSLPVCAENARPANKTPLEPFFLIARSSRRALFALTPTPTPNPVIVPWVTTGPGPLVLLSTFTPIPVPSPRNV